MRKSLYAASMLALAVAVAPACATKKFVRTEVGNVNTKVDTLSGTVEETQERTRKNEERDRRGGHEGRSGRPLGAAKRARRADAAAQSARQVNTRVDQRADGTSTTAVASTRKLVYEVTLSEDQGNFKFGKTELPDKPRPASTRWSAS